MNKKYEDHPFSNHHVFISPFPLIEIDPLGLRENAGELDREAAKTSLI